LTEVDKPEIGYNDVMIRVTRTAICGTDIHIWKWDEWAQKTIPVPLYRDHLKNAAESGSVASGRIGPKGAK
jgi:threonine 3-dehydrogenase